MQRKQHWCKPALAENSPSATSFSYLSALIGSHNTKRERGRERDVAANHKMKVVSTGRIEIETVNTCGLEMQSTKTKDRKRPFKNSACNPQLPEIGYTILIVGFVILKGYFYSALLLPPLLLYTYTQTKYICNT